MLKRLWFLLCALWAIAFIGAGFTDEGGGPIPRDFAIGLAPLILGWFLVRAARFVVTGSVQGCKYRFY